MDWLIYKRRAHTLESLRTTQLVLTLRGSVFHLVSLGALSRHQRALEEHLSVLGVLEPTVLLPWGGGQLSRHLLVPMAVSYLRTVMNRSTWAAEDSGL